MGFLWEIFAALKEYAQIVELGIISVIVGMGLFAARKLRDSTQVMQGAVERADGQLRVVALGLTQEMASEIEAKFKAAIERVRMAASESNAEATTVDAGGPRVAEDVATVETERQAELQAHAKWWQPVVDMKFSDPDQPQPRLHWKNNVRSQLPWHGTWLTGWHNDSPDGVCGVALSGRGPRIDAFWRKIRSQAADLESELPEGATVESGRFGIGVMRPNAEFRDDDERRAWIMSNLDHFASVLRPRMKALAEKQV